MIYMLSFSQTTFIHQQLRRIVWAIQSPTYISIANIYFFFLTSDMPVSSIRFLSLNIVFKVMRVHICMHCIYNLTFVERRRRRRRRDNADANAVHEPRFKCSQNVYYFIYKIVCDGGDVRRYYFFLYEYLKISFMYIVSIYTFVHI